LQYTRCMPRFSLQKLVRDNIVAQQTREGAIPTYHTLTGTALAAALITKLVEEAHEIPTTDAAEATKEIADVQQVLDDLKQALGISDESVAEAQQAKLTKNGGFQKGHYIESVNIADDDNFWVGYYRKDPAKYPES